MSTNIRWFRSLLNPQQEDADIGRQHRLDSSIRHIKDEQAGRRHHCPPKEHHEQRYPTKIGGSYAKLQQKASGGRHKYEDSTLVFSAYSTSIGHRRPPRPRYTCEEMHFIWYHRVDLKKEWSDCIAAFNEHFCSQGHTERKIPGIQCKLYRFMYAQKCPTVRKTQRSKNRILPKHGVVDWCRVSYPWMKAEHQRLLRNDEGYCIDGRGKMRKENSVYSP
ncbi:conserved hypothetical protein [Talaromyces stipitatus ATCC 10500]|uniref:Uncharacterized protein n=1 Tax=Talaromyces stipitatus (strain ATCC 10500 / CBS 375.48 / QM 6759 / NRRL 1006) TaxID=441959 RepID=B8MUP5_TALSN|nr:uncharacterized protein TSTA_108950 [Talaromyces stipitatus ATCC 10500]EED11714.1 conserved hypothetical protein [Talaromyces stipitatus ATCC 10500]